MLIMLSLKTEKAEMERARERMEGFRRIGWQESICQEWNIYPNGNGNDVDGRQHQYQPNEMWNEKEGLNWGIIVPNYLWNI